MPPVSVVAKVKDDSEARGYAIKEVDPTTVGNGSMGHVLVVKAEYEDGDGPVYYLNKVKVLKYLYFASDGMDFEDDEDEEYEFISESGESADDLLF